MERNTKIDGWCDYRSGFTSLGVKNWDLPNMVKKLKTVKQFVYPV